MEFITDFSLLEILLFALSVRYLTAVLRFSLQTDGFFSSSTNKAYIRVARDAVIEKYPVNVFNRIQRLFGAFEVSQNGEGIYIWQIRPHQIAVWTCPVCLSFWISCAFFLICLLLRVWQPIYLQPVLLILGSAGFASYDKS